MSQTNDVAGTDACDYKDAVKPGIDSFPVLKKSHFLELLIRFRSIKVGVVFNLVKFFKLVIIRQK